MDGVDLAQNYLQTGSYQNWKQSKQFIFSYIYDCFVVGSTRA